jgi:prevent-host-death family protein
MHDHGIMTMLKSMMKTKTIPAGTFKAQCLAIMDEVHAKREAVVITKRGKPVAKLVPIQEEKDEIFGFLRGRGKVVGDVVSPAITPEEWGDLY